jgi:membrane protein YqaA with SNARE-associated domain
VLEVAAAPVDHELDIVSGGEGALSVIAADGGGDGAVAPAVDEQLWHAEGQELRGRRDGIALRHLVGCPAEKIVHDAQAQLEPSGLPQIGDTGLGHDVRHRHPWLRRRSRRRPQGEVPAGRVTDRRDPGRVEADLCDGVNSGGDVCGDLGPTSLGQAPVFEVPDGQSGTREILAKPVHEPTVVAGAPEAAVQDDGDAGSPFAMREEELAVLVRVVAVAVRAARDDGDLRVDGGAGKPFLPWRDKPAVIAFLHFPSTVGYAGVALLVGIESAGVPVPGETSLIAAAVVASQGQLSLPLVIAVAAGAAILGDNVGYVSGRRGSRWLLTRVGRWERSRGRLLNRGEAFFERHGPKAVFLGRWVPSATRVTTASPWRCPARSVELA